MPLRTLITRSSIVVLIVLAASAVEAQDGAWGNLSVSLARLDYDLSGTGHAPALAVRTTRDLTANVRLEVGGVFAKPEQQFGPSTLFMPEAQLQYRWQAGRLAPYVGGGVGTALVKSDFHSDWDPTLSFAAGSAVRLTRRVDVTGEFRLRGHEWNFTGTSAEFSAGLAWRFADF